MGLDTVEMLMEIEAEFGVDIPDSEAERIVTVGDLYDCVMPKVLAASDSASPPDAYAIWHRVRAIVRRYSAGDIRKILRSTSIVDDLHMD